MIIILVPILKKKKNSDSFPCASYIYIILTCFIFYFAAEREIEIYRERYIIHNAMLLVSVLPMLRTI